MKYAHRSRKIIGYLSGMVATVAVATVITNLLSSKWYDQIIVAYLFLLLLGIGVLFGATAILIRLAGYIKADSGFYVFAGCLNIILCLAFLATFIAGRADTVMTIRFCIPEAAIGAWILLDVLCISGLPDN